MCLLLVSACASDNALDERTTQEENASVPSEPILDPQQWLEEYPDQVRSFMTATESAPEHDYLEHYPWLATIYEGSGFAKSYFSPRPHLNALEDVKATLRINEKSPSSCFSCKTPQYTIAELKDADALYSMTFYEVSDQMTQTITCYDCHKNEPGRGQVGRSGFRGGFLGSTRRHFNEQFTDIDQGTASCGQCHNEYYFDPDTKAVKLPGSLTDPKDIFEFYQSIDFVDYENTLTGTQHLKAQHPEFQSYTNSVHDVRGLSCADCHLERVNGRGGQFTNHRITDPVDSPIIRRSVCLPCHGDEGSLELVERTQARTKEQTEAIAIRLAAFTERFGAAVSAGSLAEAQLEELRALNREAQWYWDWVIVDNGYGVHNPTQAKECLDRADELLAQAEALLP